MEQFQTWSEFDDGQRSVDFVLAYKQNDLREANIRKRAIFETNLEFEGLDLERDTTQSIHFVKIHAPHDVLTRYCEVLKIKLPLKDALVKNKVHHQGSLFFSKMKSIFGKPFRLDPRLFPRPEHYFKAEFSREKSYL